MSWDVLFKALHEQLPSWPPAPGPWRNPAWEGSGAGEQDLGRGHLNKSAMGWVAWGVSPWQCHHGVPGDAVGIPVTAGEGREREAGADVSEAGFGGCGFPMQVHLHLKRLP